VLDETGAIRELYLEAFRWYDPRRKTPPVHVSFYPYVGINHTIRLRAGEVFVRISEICLDMPISCHKGLAFILVGKLLRKKIPEGAREVYNAFVKSDHVRRAADERKKSRGRKVVTSSRGSVYDLDTIFDEVNARYFATAVAKPALTWSARKTYRILGHHDAAHDHVAISRSLDQPDVPRYVVEYVLFHEMLHIVHPTRHVNGRRYNHTAAFRRDERKFAQYEQAERWIELNVRRLKRESKRR
jgi:hypothetical protein